MTELNKVAMNMIKDGLKSCTEAQVHLFRKIYWLPEDIVSHTDTNIIGDEMQDSKTEWVLEHN